MGLKTGHSRRTGGRRWLTSHPVRSFVVLFLSTIVGTPVLAGGAEAPPHARGTQEAAARSTAAGVYTSEQADRGRAAFDAKCQSCHGAALDGGTLAPALKGGEFLSGFQQKPLRRLYSRIISTMPPDDVGSLTESETLALVALVLRANGYPAGPEALARADDLNAILVLPPEKADHVTWNAEDAETAETAENKPLRSISLRARRALRSRSVR